MKKSYNKIYHSLVDKKLFNIILLSSLTVGTLVPVPRVKASEINTSNVLREVNVQRTRYDLKPLYLDGDLYLAATLKSKDMLNRNYFEHYAFGLSPWDFINIQGYDFAVAGENLAMDFATSEGMVRAWMDSPAHRDNILNPQFEDIGIGVIKGTYNDGNNMHETVMVTNLFAKKKSKIAIYFDTLLKKLIRW